VSTPQQDTSYRFSGDASDLLAELVRIRTALSQTGKDADGAGQKTEDSFNKSKSAADRFVESLRREYEAIGKTRDELLRMRGAELGVSEATDKLIHQINAKKVVMGGAAKQTGLAAHEVAQLNMQLTDVFVQLQGGTNPFTILLQQGGQVKDMLGGIGPALQKIGALFTPVRIGILAGAAAVGTLVGALVIGRNESIEFDKALLMTGNRAGATAGDFDRLSQKVRDNTAATISSAREAVQAAISTGQFGPLAIGPVAQAVAVLAERTGEKAEDIAKDFARMSDGVAKFAAEKNKSLNFLTVAQYKYLRALEATGQAERAQAELATLIAERVGKKLPHELGSLERGWLSVKKAASEAWDAMKGIGRAETVDDQIANTVAQLAAAKAALDNPRSTRSREQRQQVVDSVQGRLTELGRRALRERENATATAEAAAENQRLIREQQSAHIDATVALDRAGFTSRQAIAEFARTKELDANERAYTQLEINLTQYLQRRTALEQQSIDAKLAAINVEIGLEQRRVSDSPDDEIAKKARITDLETKRVAVLRERYELEKQLRNGFDNIPGRGEAQTPGQQFAQFERGQQQATQAAFDQRTLAARQAARDLVETNRELGIELIRDDRTRAEAQLAIEEERIRKTLDLGAMSADEQKKVEGELAQWRVNRMALLNEQMKPQFARLLEEWRNTSKRMREEGDEFATGLLRGGEDAFVQLGKTGKLELSSLLDFANEMLFRKLYRDTIGPALENGIKWVTEQVFGKSDASPAVDPSKLAAQVAQEQMTASVTASSLALKSLDSIGVTPATGSIGRMAIAADQAAQALAQIATTSGGGGGGLAGLLGGMFNGAGGGAGGGGFDAGSQPIPATFAANGMAFARGVHQFALGNAFSNKVFNQPTMFRFGNGGANLGIMGEAGDEAVMPLRRGPGGRLGVSLWNGARGGSGSPTVHQQVTYHVAAGVSPAMLAAAMEINNQRTKGEVMQSFMRNGDMRRASERF
jgi:phage-related minor tail protein